MMVSPRTKAKLKLMFGETTDKYIDDNKQVVHPNKLFMSNLIGALTPVGGTTIWNQEKKVIKQSPRTIVSGRKSKMDYQAMVEENNMLSKKPSFSLPT
jgi:hypothetical protein